MNLYSKSLKINDILLWSLLMTAFLILAYYPYIPLEGDAFGCWYQYVDSLKTFSLGRALADADAPGRYPGLPFTIVMIEVIFQVSYLTALAIMRCLFACLFVSSIYYFFKHVFQFENTNKLIWLIFLFPTLLASSFLNTQDSIKIFSFVYAIAFFVRYMNTQRKVYLYWSYFFSIYLGLSRSVEILPYYVFVATYIYFESKNQWSKKIKTILKTSGLSFGVLALLHVYGKIKLGHWGVSGSGAAPDIWPVVARKYIHSLELTSGWEKIGLFMKLLAVNISNKVHYFITDYFLGNGVSVMRGANTLASEFAVSSGYGYCLAILVVGLSLVTLYLVFKKYQVSPVFKALCLAAFTSAGFYTFGLNHYEPRYWSITFIIIWFVLVFVLNKKIKMNVMYVLLICLGLFFSYRFAESKIVLDRQTSAESEVWKSDIRKVCTNEHIHTIKVPHDYYHWSSYRYFVSMECERLRIEPALSGFEIDALDFVVEGGEVRVPLKYFAGVRVIGLSPMMEAK